MVPRQAWISGVFAATALFVAGCAGAGSSPTSGSPPSGLSANPASITNLGSPTLVLISGAQGSVTITVGDQRLLDVSAPVINGNAVAFTITEVAGGSTTVTVSDATHAAVTIPVNNLMCLPPQPNLALFREIVAATSTYIYFITPVVPQPNTNPSSFPYTTRLIGSDRSIVEGSGLTFLGLPGAAQPPPPPASPPPGQDVYYSVVQPLFPSLTYQVQLVGRGCEPPFVVGSFST